MGYFNDRVDFETLKGKTLKDIQRGDRELAFVTDGGETYRMLHLQDCCESVYIEDICGDLDDLIGSEILKAEEVTSSNHHPDEVQSTETVADREWGWESFTWTFYKLSTIDGDVTIRWLGKSNGYYSERVDLVKE